MTQHCTCCGQPLPSTAERILFDGATRRITVDGEAYGPFQPSEFRLARVLIDAAPQMLTLRKIHHEMYGDREDGGADMPIIKRHVCMLRRKFKGARLKVETLYGEGYRAVILPAEVRG